MSILASFKPQSHLGRVLLAVFAVFIAGLMALFITAPAPDLDKKEIAQIAEPTPEEEAKKAFRDKLSEDGDNDGLREWEEAVYKTNPDNPDTDGDGTKDGDEIRQNRNPLAKGPDDLTTPLAEPNPITFKIEKGNATQEFMQKIMNDPEFANSIQNQDNPFSEQSIEKYLKELPVNLLIGEVKPLDLKKLNITDNQSIPSVQKYFEESALLWAKHKEVFKNGDDWGVLARITENPATELTKLDGIVAALEQVMREANLLTIPKNVLWFHQKDIAFGTKYKNEIVAIRKLFASDPLGAVIVINEHIKTKQQINELYGKELKPWLLQNNITLLPVSALFFLGPSAK